MGGWCSGGFDADANYLKRGLSLTLVYAGDAALAKETTTLWSTGL